jgi:uncharacterized protein YegL
MRRAATLRDGMVIGGAMADTQGDVDFDQEWEKQLLQAHVEFADNPEPRCPCVLLLDTSGSMKGDPLRALVDGLIAFRDELLKDSLAKRRVEIAIISFGGDVKVIQDFVTAENFPIPILQAGGLTPMGDAINKALDLLDARKRQFKANGVTYYRPWIFMITDGAPEGEPEQLVRQATQRLRGEETAKRVAFFGVGVQNANMAKLAEICQRPPLRLKGLRFVDQFVWLSRSMQQVANSKVGDQVALPPVDWGMV